MKHRLYSSIKVKPYAYRWLVNKFQIKNEPEGCISLGKHRLLNLVFRNMLQYKSRLTIVKQKDAVRRRSLTIHIAISNHNLEHYGLDLTEDCRSEFATLVEVLCQEDFRLFFFHQYMVEPRIRVILEKFQQFRGYSEEEWPLESLQKLVTRMHITSHLRSARQEYMQKYNEFFTANLSKIMDCNSTKIILSSLCNSTSTPEEASEDSMPFQSKTSSE